MCVASPFFYLILTHNLHSVATVRSRNTGQHWSRIGLNGVTVLAELVPLALSTSLPFATVCRLLLSRNICGVTSVNRWVRTFTARKQYHDAFKGN